MSPGRWWAGVVGVCKLIIGRHEKTYTTDVITIDALKLFEKVVFCEAFLSSRRKYRGTSMFKTVSKPLAHLNFLSGVNCYDIGSKRRNHFAQSNQSFAISYAVHDIATLGACNATRGTVPRNKPRGPSSTNIELNASSGVE